jgi:aminoglycoside phosphotransferase family enzyme/predicted kinase
MITEDQSEIIELLESSTTYGGAHVERIDTHTAVVFLAGSRAWKLKRAVQFDYLDSSTPERRKQLCEAEVALSRRTAPAIYRGVLAVTRERDGSLALGGSGTPVDWVVEMNRFDQSALLDRMAGDGRLELGLMPRLGNAIARFHQSAERRPYYGGAAGIQRVIDGNGAGFDEYGQGALDADLWCRVIRESRLELERRRSLLDTRARAGCVRQCHGDLHLRNIVLLRGEPVLFDTIEFNDDIACIDVLYDIAFLLMDLERRALPRHANAVWNAYLHATGDLDGLAAMPLLLSCRAAVRAKTSVTAAHFQGDAPRAAELRALAREYVALAVRLLKPLPARLIAIGGFSGSGKSTLALAIAPSIGAVPGALVLRSDEIRKELGGVALTERLGPDGYAPEMSERVYSAIAARANLIIRSGHSVIVDAVYGRENHRNAIERVATDAGVNFAGFWLDAPAETLVDRVQSRRADVSDADARVISEQRARDAGTIRWARVDASLGPDAVRQDVEHLLESLTAEEYGSRHTATIGASH